MLAVSFATRGVVSENKEVIEVMHFLGATDTFIAREFYSRFLINGLKGSLMGALLSIVFFLTLGIIKEFFFGLPQTVQLTALFGDFTLSLKGYTLIALIAVGFALIVALTSRVIVLSILKKMQL